MTKVKLKPPYMSKETMNEYKRWSLERGIPQRVILARRKEKEKNYESRKLS